jgi:radical SAM protein with 4Fe4S-binding SPASM domain
LAAIARVAAAHGAAFRVNVYQAVKTDAFSLTYDQFWAGFRLLLEACPIAVCSEPLVRAVLGLGPRAEGCGCTTVRVTPRGEVLPCVYWQKRSLTLADLERLGADVVRSAAFAELDTLPDPCRECPLVDVCHGGCASRRMLRGGLELPDEFCPFVNGRPLPRFPVHRRAARDFPKSASACTSIFTDAG